jgi:pseudaminic acid biosynthesis-associated methylase
MGIGNKYATEQEDFWYGEFGKEYIQRNQGKAVLALNLSFFSKALHVARELDSCIEFGANIGMNLAALKLLHPEIDVHAIEINPDAVRSLSEVISPKNIYHQSILDFEPQRTWTLSIIRGVLIHINPDHLPSVYDKLVSSCSRYLLVAEYYNPVPVSLPYRGHADRLFKRDFAGEIMDRHPQMKLLDYGFSYRRDNCFLHDDITWFLMEKV